MGDLIKVAMFVAIVTGGGDAGQGVASRFVGLVKGDGFAIAKSLSDTRVAPISFSGGKPVRFGW